jgi:hypothetical protein
MLSVPKPLHTARSTLELCADHVQDEAKSIRLHGIATFVEAAEIDYLAKGATSQLHLIQPSQLVGGGVNGDEMVNLYTGNLAKKNTAARHIYDSLKSSAAHNICPLCAQRDVDTLDHYLSKSHFPSFAVSPINLVPACMHCNRAKLATQAINAAQQPLHPYFDAIDSTVWLHADVIQTTPPALSFRVIPDLNWTQLLADRVQYHFEIFKLSSLYSTHAGKELVNIRFGLAEAATANSLQVHLAGEARIRRKGARNSWQAAMHEALANSVWFCTTGYKLIA